MTDAVEAPPAIETSLRSAARRAGVDSVVDGPGDALAVVERRRLQVWGVVLFVLCSVGLVAVLASFGGDEATRWVSAGSLRFALLALVVGTSIYAVEKELQLRRLERLLVDERSVSGALARRLDEHRALAAAGRAANSADDLVETLDRILAEALGLLDATSGSILLTEGSDTLRVVVGHGPDIPRDARVRLGESIAGKVAQRREPLLLHGPVDAGAFPGRGHPTGPVGDAMCTPLLHRGELLGVLNVNGGPHHPLDEEDLEVLVLFAEPAAAAIANARLFADERAHVAELLALDEWKSAFLGAAGRELHAGLGAARAAVQAASDAPPAGVGFALVEADLHLRRIDAMLGDIAESAVGEPSGVLPLLRPVDVAALVRMVAFDAQLAGRPVRVEAPEHVAVRADPDALRRIVGNLVDNAHRHGAPPVTVSVGRVERDVVVTVSDAGPGVPLVDRERVFERFQRLDASAHEPGVGIGLAIVRGLVRACGGTVWVDDAPAGGAAFHVRLSAVEAAPRAEDVQPAAAPATVRSS